MKLQKSYRVRYHCVWCSILIQFWLDKRKELNIGWMNEDIKVLKKKWLRINISKTDYYRLRDYEFEARNYEMISKDKIFK